MLEDGPLAILGHCLPVTWDAPGVTLLFGAALTSLAMFCTIGFAGKGATSSWARNPKYAYL